MPPFALPGAGPGGSRPIFAKFCKELHFIKGFWEFGIYFLKKWWIFQFFSSWGVNRPPPPWIRYCPLTIKLNSCFYFQNGLDPEEIGYLRRVFEKFGQSLLYDNPCVTQAALNNVPRLKFADGSSMPRLPLWWEEPEGLTETPKLLVRNRRAYSKNQNVANSFNPGA